MKRILVAVITIMFALLGLPQASAATVDVTVYSQSGELSDGDRSFLTTETAKLQFPEQVKHVHYVLLTTNDSKFNDTVEKFAKSEHPDWVSSDQKKWAPGVLIVAVGLDPRRNGIYCGDDVCAALNLDGNSHLEKSLDAGKDSFKSGRYAAGLFAMTKASLEESSGIGGWIAGGMAALGGFIALIATPIVIRRNKIKKARENFDYISKHYADVAQRFSEIDIMAHNLSSPLADEKLRREFNEVKSQFLSVHELQQRIPDLAGAADGVFAKYAKDIGKMKDATEKMKTAATNIETLSNMERGDETVRRNELSRIRVDLREATLKTQAHYLEGQRLVDLTETIDVHSPEFMNTFARLLDDTALFFKLVAEEQKLKGQEKGSVPRIYESGWAPGYGYHSYVSFTLMNTWHDDAIQAESSSSSVDSSYSSGFSGGGGSSSW
ncbi:DUF5129 domain-containing protein [Corynebacterium epidermidicanis]|uniref:DUF5129 domain-containing protein n=1 Tax=Corynebacterium epidermidicanis TaxID=1050174 RepID=A0A0G3GSN7_9CORY|nr:DUF5129 domain-containing protein [Corynebacterium epidermidicanis]AKK04161.1 hypothetical protein CEPID_11665 [Corynebacterium epidermidicanis]